MIRLGIRARAALLLLLFFSSAGLYAQSADTTRTEQDSDTELARLDASILHIEGLRPLVAELNLRYEALDPEDALNRTITDARLDRAWDSLVGEVHDATGLILTLVETGADVSSQQTTVEELLVSVPEASFAIVDRLASEVTMPTKEQTAPEQAAVYARASLAITRVNTLFDQVLENLELQRQSNLDVSVEEQRLNSRLEDRAVAISAFLDVSNRDVDALEAQSSVLPDDADVAAKLAVARQLVVLSADVLRSVSEQMKTQDLDTGDYEAQLIATTGEITTDLLDVSVLGGLVSSAWDAVAGWFAENGAGLIFSMLIFLLIIYATFKFARIVQRLVTAGLDRGQVRLSKLLKRMIVSTTRGMIIIIGLLLALSQLGISLGPLLAGLGIAGFVIGFALQDTLSNFASGMMILLYRPFDVGDVVEAGTVFGTVSHMSLVNTTILTLDNQTLVVPNNKIWGDVIKNLNSQDRRRVDMTFGIGYADDIPLAEKVLNEIVANNSAILADPEPLIRLHELGESSVNFVVRPWVNSDDYWPVYWDITREVKMRFDSEGISIPFPQRDVHLYAETPSNLPSSGSSDTHQDSVRDHQREFDDTKADTEDD